MVITKMTFAVIICIIFVTGLSIIYFSKRRIDNDENRIYKRLLIINIVGLFLHILSDIVSCHYDVIPHFICTVILKTYLIYFYAFGVILLSYLYTISKVKFSYIYDRLVYSSILIFYVFIYFLPQKIHIDNASNIFYTYGTDVRFVYGGCAILSILLVLVVILNMKVLQKKKTIPLFVFLFSSFISIFIQRYNPDIVIIDCIESVVVLLMYFTIENPDLQMIEELNIARDRADKANNAKTEFLSSMSHEIRTPLNAIDGFSQLILEENDINIIKDEARDIMSASKNLLELVNGILDISKIEADKLEIIDVEYEPAEIFKDVCTLAKSRIGDKPVDFRQHIAEDLPDYLNGDYTRIKQIALNILTNAVKYTKSGYVDFSVRCVKQDDICRLIIIVKDTGIGIKKENIDKLFQKFERFDKEKNVTIEGTGLGLAITKKLVDLMHGKIIADSRYGYGSIFAVVIDQKIINKKKTIDMKIPLAPKTEFKNAKVLVVDDNKINLKVASKLLETYGIDVETVESGFDCINKINSGSIYSLVLMDDMMPKMSGTETFKKLKETPDFNIPVIALTANAIVGMREKYLSEGFSDYIAKPIEKRELERVLNTYLN